MPNAQSYSEYVEELRRKLEGSDQVDQLDVLVQEMANMRLQIKNLMHIVSALAVYQDAVELLPASIRDGGLKARLPSSALIDARHHLTLANGFYNIEYTAAGEAFRWTGPSKAFTLNVWIDRSTSISLRLNAFHFGHPLNEFNTQLYVDGLSVPVQWDNERKCFFNEIIQLVHSEQITSIEFQLAALLANKPDDDDRQLGIPFCSLTIDCNRET